LTSGPFRKVELDPKALKADLGPPLVVNLVASKRLDYFDQKYPHGSQLAVLPGTFQFEYVSPYASEYSPVLPPLRTIEILPDQSMSANIAPDPRTWKATVAITADVAHFKEPDPLHCSHITEHGIFAVLREQKGMQDAIEQDYWSVPSKDVLRNSSSNFGIMSYGLRDFKELNAPNNYTPPASRGASITVAALADSRARYEIVAGNQALPIAPRAGESLKIKLPRIDVNHVELTQQPGGGQYFAYGKVRLYISTAQGGWKLLTFPSQRVLTNPSGYPSCRREDPVIRVDSFQTASGLDVIPGRYTVVVDYQVDGPNLSQEFEVTL
jgi:hypothetical protein